MNGLHAAVLGLASLLPSQAEGTPPEEQRVERTQEMTELEVHALISGLDSDAYDSRQEASRKLYAAGRRIRGILEEEMKSTDSAAVRYRILSILRQWNLEDREKEWNASGRFISPGKNPNIYSVLEALQEQMDTRVVIRSDWESTPSDQEDLSLPIKKDLNGLPFWEVVDVIRSVIGNATTRCDSDGTIALDPTFPMQIVTCNSDAVHGEMWHHPDYGFGLHLHTEQQMPILGYQVVGADLVRNGKVSDLGPCIDPNWQPGWHWVSMKDGKHLFGGTATVVVQVEIAGCETVTVPIPDLTKKVKVQTPLCTFQYDEMGKRGNHGIIHNDGTEQKYYEIAASFQGRYKENYRNAQFFHSAMRCKALGEHGERLLLGSSIRSYPTVNMDWYHLDKPSSVEFRVPSKEHRTVRTLRFEDIPITPRSHLRNGY